MEVIGFGPRIEIVGVLALVFYRLLDEATVVEVGLVVALVEVGFARVEVSDLGSPVTTGLCLTLGDAFSRC